MKKLIFTLLLVAAGWHMASADIHSDAKFVAQEDSFSNEIGQNYGGMIAKMINADPKMNKAEFLKAFNLLMSVDTANAGYWAGVSVAMQYLDMTRSIKQRTGINIGRDAFLKGFTQAINGPIPADSVLNNQNKDLMARMQSLSETITADLAQTNAKAGAAYLTKTVKADKKYKVTKSGLAYKLLQKGNGKLFADADKVRLKYEGRHIDGSVFDASRDTVAFEVSKMVPGFTEALKLMSPGAKLTCILPMDLAYGAKGAGRDPRTGKWSIEPGEYLVFNIETYGVEAPKADKTGTDKAVAPAKKAAPAKASPFKTK